MQAGGQRAGRRIFLTADGARALEYESSMIEVVSAELQRGGMQVKSAYNAAALIVDGIEPQYQYIRTIDVAVGRGLTFADEEEARRVAIIGAEAAAQLFGSRPFVGEALHLNGLPYTIIGGLRTKDQDSSYNGRDNEKIVIPFSAMARDCPRTDAPPGALSQIILAPRPEVVAQLPEIIDNRTGRIEDIDWPIDRELRRVLSRRHGFDPDDREALQVWDTSIESLMMGRMVGGMQEFFGSVGLVTLALGGIGVMNIMLIAVRERTREIGVRKALGATTGLVQRQFFLEGFLLTMLSGAIGYGIALGLCAAVNSLPLPPRFSGMIVTWQAALGSIAALVLIGVVTATLPARRAAMLPPVEALRAET